MFKNYKGLWLLLAVAFIIMLGVSIFGPVSFGNIELKQSRLADAVLVYSDTTESKSDAKDSLPGIHSDGQETLSVPKFPVETDTASKVIMFIGDSMLEGLSPRLAAYAAANGHTLYTVMWYSSHSQAWGKSDKIKKYIAQLKPDYIFICLGSNELFVKDIKEKRTGYVQKMVSDIGDIPFLWIGPPNWKPDTGINEIIAENVPEGSYFKSDGMHFDRSKDGAHPTRSSAILWMDSVARWMPMHSNHPIKMETPEQRTGRPKKIFVHQPSEIQ